jgi:hypothetical protein
MKFKNLFSFFVFAFVFTSRIISAQAFEEFDVQKSLRDILKSNPAVSKYVDEAMKLFRETECSKSGELKRPSGSKRCTDLLSYDKAEAASAADLKACEAKCSAGAAGAKPANGKGQDADLAKCVDQACKDECARKEVLFKLELDHYLKGSMMESLQMNEYMSKSGATIWMNK